MEKFVQQSKRLCECFFLFMLFVHVPAGAVPCVAEVMEAPNKEVSLFYKMPRRLFMKMERLYGAKA